MKLLTTLVLIILIWSAMAGAQKHSIELLYPDEADNSVAPLLGVISGPDPNCPENGENVPDVSRQYQEIGVMFVRNNDYYDDRLDMERMFQCDTMTYPSWRCDPEDPANLHFDGSDEQFRSYLDGGFIPFFRLGGEYESCRRTHDYKGPQDSLEEANWIKAALKVVGHYNNFDGQNNVLKYLNIWTEFPGPHFWSRSDKAFYIFWATAFDSIKKHFPDLLVGGPGFVPKATLDILNGELNSVPVEFLTELYNRNLKPDWIGWHYWNNDPSQYILAAEQFRDLLNGEGDFSSLPWAGSGYFDGVKQYVDAYGTSVVENINGEMVAYDKVTKDSIYNKQKGAAILTGQWIALQYTDVELACYYRGSPQGTSGPDEDPTDPKSRISGPSLFYGDPDGTPKPSAYAFGLWSKVYRDFPQLLQSPVMSQNSEGRQLWIMGAKNEKNYAVLLSNLESVPQQYTLIVESKAVNLQNFDKVDIYEVTNTNDGRTPSEWSGRDFIIPAHTVQLLVLTPKTVGLEEAEIAQPAAFKVRAVSVISDGVLKATVESPAPSNARLAIFNVLGQRIYVRSSIPLRKGEQQLRITLPQLSRGMYFARLQNGFGTRHWKFLIGW